MTALIIILVVTVTSLYVLFNSFDWESLKNVPKETVAICSTVTLLLVTLCFKWPRYSKKTIITNNLENQIGYLIPPGRSREQVIRLLRQVKIAGEIPPLYPNSWYEAMRSDELPIGGVKAVYLIEKHLVVFRNEKGTVCVLDAYCPHLGANLGVGGIVKGNCIKCPFHGWEFDGETGKCTSIPYTDNAVPSYAKTNVWHSIERNGFICVWFDAEGREPSYFPEDIAQIVTKKWTYRGCCVHYINAHIQDLCENAADAAHFQTIHGPAIGGGSSLDFQISNQNWLNRILTVHLKINWEVLESPNSHIGHTTIDSYYTLFNKWRLPFCVHAELHQIGPGFLLVSVQLPIGEGIFIQTFVPEGPMMIRMTSYLYFDWWIPSFITNRVLHELATQVDRDALIWNNKTHRSKPLLAKEEEGIKNLRKWFSQFYSENSPKLNIRKNLDSPLIW